MNRLVKSPVNWSGFARRLLLCICLGCALPAAADVFWEFDPTVYAKGGSISLEDATDIVRRAYGGRVLSASPAKQNGKRGYKVRVLLDGGRVKTVFVDSNGSVQG